MSKKLVVLLIVAAVFCTGKFVNAEQKAKASPAKQSKVVETRINEGDMDRLTSSINRAVKEAVIAKQGPGGWEYMAKRMRPPKTNKWQGKWNGLGQEGWEAIDHFENVYIFKRPAIAAAASMTYVKPAASPAKAEPTAAPKSSNKADEKAAKKAAKEEEKTAKKAEKEKAKAEKDAKKDAKKAEKKAKKKTE